MLVGGKCSDCSKIYYPIKKVCRVCGSRDFDQVKLSDRGRLVTFTVIRSPPNGYEEYAPYVVGIVELDDGVRVISQIVDCDIENVRTGMELEATFRRTSADDNSGILMYGTKFRPVIG